MKITRFEDIKAWQEARILTKMVYDTVKNNRNFEKDIRLCGQIQSASGSVIANIAEGFMRNSDREFIQFLFIAMSSAAEVQSHLYIALDQNYITRSDFNKIYDRADKTARMISNLIKYLRSTPTKQTKQTK